MNNEILCHIWWHMGKSVPKWTYQFKAVKRLSFLTPDIKAVSGFDPEEEDVWTYFLTNKSQRGCVIEFYNFALKRCGYEWWCGVLGEQNSLSSETSLHCVIIKHKAPNGMETSVKHFLSLYLSSALLILNAFIVPPLETVVWWILPLNPRVFG